ITNAVSITDADLVISKSFNSEVFSELAETKIIAAEKALPIAIGVHLVNEHGALLPAVTGGIRLRVAINIELTRTSTPLNGKLPDRCSHSLAIPRYFTRKTDIQREQPGHLLCPPRRVR